MKKFIFGMLLIAVSIFSGGLFAMAAGAAPIIGMVVGGACSFLPTIPAGTLGAGVLTEVWTGELIKTLRAGDKASFLDGIPDYSQYAENDVIHLVDVGADPDVLINNTTYPIPIQDISDVDKPFGLDKYQTKATPVTDDELYASSYQKMASLKERHGSAIKISKYKKAIHSLAPAANATGTPVIVTTGAADNGRKRLTVTDIITLKKKFDVLEIPTEGRRLVLCSDHVNDLLLTSQTFRDQYYNYTSGKISNMYGFEIFEYISNPYYRGVVSGGDAANEKLAYGATPLATDFRASVAFYTKRAFKAMGSTKMYHSEAKNDTQHQRSLINFRHYYIVMPKKLDAMGAILSAQA